MLSNRSSHQRYSVRKDVFRNFSKFTGKHLCQSLFFNKVVQAQACNFIKKETLAQVFAFEFWEISKKTFFTEHLWATGSDQTPPLSLRVASTPCKTKTNQHWLNYLTNTPHTLNYATSLAVGVSGISQTPRVTKGRLGLTSLSHCTWFTPETKRWNLRFTQPPCFVQLHQEKKQELIYQIDKAYTCD